MSSLFMRTLFVNTLSTAFASFKLSVLCEVCGSVSKSSSILGVIISGLSSSHVSADSVSASVSSVLVF